MVTLLASRFAMCAGIVEMDQFPKAPVTAECAVWSAGFLVWIFGGDSGHLSLFLSPSPSLSLIPSLSLSPPRSLALAIPPFHPLSLSRVLPPPLSFSRKR